MLRKGAALLIASLLVVSPLTIDAEVPTSGAGLPTTHYRIDTDQSWLRVLVYRGGLLRGLGHNHVVAHRRMSGIAAVTAAPLQASFTIDLAVDDFTIDDAADRLAEGDDFPGQIPAKDIAGTRKNMLGRKLLNATAFTSIRLQSDSISGELPALELQTLVTVRDSEHALVVPAHIEISDDGFVATGEVSITHGDIGLSPFKAALGALRVRDEMVVKFEVHGVKTADKTAEDNTNHERG